MIWKYKLVEYSTNEKKEILQNIRRLKNDILKEKVVQLNWGEKIKVLFNPEPVKRISSI